MKKFMVILVALMIVPIANAVAAPINWTGTFDEATNEVTITLTSDVGLSSFSLGTVSITADAAGTWTPATLNTGWDASNTVATSGGQPAGSILYLVKGTIAVGADVVTGDMFSIVYTLTGLPASGIVNFDVAAASIATTLDGTEFEIGDLSVVVPEPITMALMGLGGLFIRRRRVA